MRRARHRWIATGSLLAAFLAAACASGGIENDAGPSDACFNRTLFADSDGDGFGDPLAPLETCDPNTPGAATNADDCDDSAEEVNPDATEVCDDRDTDCNGTVDDGVCAVGCSDGEREGFVGRNVYPDIAGCAGGFGVPGILSPIARVCSEPIGDDSVLPADLCAPIDLCAVGWHVCAEAAETVTATGGAGCTDATAPGDPSLFFIASISGPGNLVCGVGANDLFGCGNIGAPTGSCGPYTRSSQDLCSSLPAPWNCGASGVQEANMVTKLGSDAGGVLCCRDLAASPAAR